jgi:hypothetical protein
MNETAKIKAPIEIIPSDNYLLVIKDADGIYHYWHKEHENEDRTYQSGQYDGWSKDCNPEGSVRYIPISFGRFVKVPFFPNVN